MADMKEEIPEINVAGEILYGMILSGLVYAIPAGLIAMIIGPHL